MKIMFVCTGNTCRSAMAEAILKHKVQQDPELKDKIEVYSCGIFAGDGDLPIYHSIEALKEYEVDLTNHRATNIKSSHIEDMDLILCATISHKNVLLSLYPNLKDKVYTIKEYIEYDKNGQDYDIKDPWGFDLETYRFCATEIETCINQLIKKIKNK